MSSPFAILHIGHWIPGKYTDSKNNMVLINAICDVSQFVVVVPTPKKSYITLAGPFFQYVMMKSGFCHLVVLDDGNSFKGDFFTMYKTLDLNYEILAKCNHKEIYQ